MLTLTRSVGETIRIGDDIEVHVVEVRGGTVRLGFKAPREVTIHREEVYRQIAEANLLAAQVTADSLGALAAFAPVEPPSRPSRRRPPEQDERQACPPDRSAWCGRPACLAEAARVCDARRSGTRHRQLLPKCCPYNCVGHGECCALGCRGHEADFSPSK